MSGIKYRSGLFLPMDVRLLLAAFERSVSQVPARMYITGKHKQWHAPGKRTAHLSAGSELKRGIQGILIGLNSHFQLRTDRGKRGIILVLVQRVNCVTHGGDKAMADCAAVTQDLSA